MLTTYLLTALLRLIIIWQGFFVWRLQTEWGVFLVNEYCYFNIEILYIYIYAVSFLYLYLLVTRQLLAYREFHLLSKLIFSYSIISLWHIGLVEPVSSGFVPLYICWPLPMKLYVILYLLHFLLVPPKTIMIKSS